MAGAEGAVGPGRDGEWMGMPITEMRPSCHGRDKGEHAFRLHRGAGSGKVAGGGIPPGGRRACACHLCADGEKTAPPEP